VETINELDKTHGPITHLYEVNGVSNHLKDSTQWGLVSSSSLILPCDVAY
jgi:hypothetical protein